MFSAPIKCRLSSNVYFHNYTQEETPVKSLKTTFLIACLERKTSPNDETGPCRGCDGTYPVRCEGISMARKDVS